jgi:hypothetical protein
MADIGVGVSVQDIARFPRALRPQSAAGIFYQKLTSNFNPNLARHRKPNTPSARELFNYSKLPVHNMYNQSFYTPMTHHMDHRKIIDDKKQLSYNTYKRRRPKSSKLAARFGRAAKCQEFLQVKKHSENVPAPWKYELGIKWMKGYKGKDIERQGALVGIEVREGKDKRLFKRWKNYKAGNPEKEDLNDVNVKVVKKGRGKLDMKVKFIKLAYFNPFLGQ